MEFKHRALVELPFVLNVPDGAYQVATATGTRTLSIHQNFYAGACGSIEYFSPVLVGPKDEVLAKLPNTERISTLQLHTVVSAEEMREVSESDLVVPTDEDLRQHYAEKSIRDGMSSSVGDKLLTEASRAVSLLSEAQLEEFRRQCSLKLTAKRLFPPDMGNEFIVLLNTFLRKYMTELDDFFVEELTLHQVGGTTTRGVMQVTTCGDKQIDSVTLIGKIPPIMRNIWFAHPKERIDGLRANLATQDEANAVALLGVRARAFLEQGACRSAIIEASAALETAVARRLLVALTARGKTETEASKYLQENQRFSCRCKDIFRDMVGKSLADYDNVLWSRVVAHRDSYRHKIAHSDQEPPKAEAQKVVNDFLALAQAAQTMEL